MSTDLPNLPSDAQLLYEYLGKRIHDMGENRPAVEVIADLDAYSRQLEQLRDMVGKAEGSLAQGRARELDLESLLDRVRMRITAEDNGGR